MSNTNDKPVNTADIAREVVADAGPSWAAFPDGSLLGFNGSREDAVSEIAGQEVMRRELERPMEQTRYGVRRKRDYASATEQAAHDAVHSAAHAVDGVPHEHWITQHPTIAAYDFADRVNRAEGDQVFGPDTTFDQIIEAIAKRSRHWPGNGSKK